MDIYQLAKDMELEGRNYYVQLATQTEDVQMRRVFEILADEEASHYQMLDAMQTKVNLPLITSQFDDAETIFRVYLLENIELRSANGVLEAYGQAVNLEKNAIDYYRRMSRLAESASEKAVFLRMHFEEKKHKFLLENIMELLRDTIDDAPSAENANSMVPENL